MNIVLDTELNPNGYQLMRFMQDDSVRYIYMYGGSSSGKSFSAAQMFLVFTLKERENHLVLRKVGASIARTIYEDFRVACEMLGLKRFFSFVQNSIRCVNGARIDFGGLDDPEKIKGISNYKRVLLEELSEFDESDFKQIRKRLRGKKGQQVLCDWNPISEGHWVKRKVIDVEQWHDIDMRVNLGGQLARWKTEVKSLKMNAERSVLNARTGEVETHRPDSVLIQSTYLNNFWVVGSKTGKFGFYDEQTIADFEKDRIHDPDYYRVYALGEWGIIRTGSEFLWAFKQERHVFPVPYDSRFPIHLSIDNNVLPYITTQFWQKVVEDGHTHIREVGELMAETPNNSVRRAATLVADRLRGMGYTEKVFVHADASTKSANTIDEDKRSFIDLYMSTLNERGYETEDCVGRGNPSVSMTGEFVNLVLDGAYEDISIEIDTSCRVGIEDYQKVQKDDNGGILKTRVKNKMTGQSYEAVGHNADCLRYIVHDFLRDDFIAFSNKRKYNVYAKEGSVNFFNGQNRDHYEYEHKIAYCIPNFAGRLVLVQGNKLGDKWHIVRVVFRESDSTQEVSAAILSLDAKTVVMECPETYYQYIRELRQRTSMEIRVAPDKSASPDGRISATTEYVMSSVLFDSVQSSEEGDYQDFLSNMYDYNLQQKEKAASYALSGLVQQMWKYNKR